MVFSSIEFLTLFLPAVLLGSLVLRKNVVIANLWLTLCSVLFYAYGEPQWISGFLLQILVNYAGGLVIGGAKKSGFWKKTALFLFVALNLGVLVYFKYLNLFGETLFGLLEREWTISAVMPIGISFYSFQVISYLADVYKGRVEAQKNPLDLLLYVSMFPQLVAGPIVRYEGVAEELRERKTDRQDFADGARRFISGLSKKVLLANQLAVFADLAFTYDIDYLRTWQAWLGAVCYAFQIYFDFSGYSDMALGMGRMLGFHFSENFRCPYLAQSIRDFWRRWHISLSSFFRDYVYIPLGGSKKGRWKTCRNLLVVFALCGFWHGASWNFLCWGLYYGIFLTLERTDFFSGILERMPGFFRRLYALLAVLFGWVLFRAETLTSAFAYWRVMLGLGGNRVTVDLFAYEPGDKVFCFVCLAVLVSFVFEKQRDGREERSARVPALFWDAAALCLLVLCMVELSALGYNPFIYFRF